MRWHLYDARSVFVIVENPEWSQAQPKEQVKFLAISRGSGSIREGQETPDGLQGKLAQLTGAGNLTPRPFAALFGCLQHEQEAFLVLAADATVAAEVDGKQILEVATCETIPFTPAEEPTVVAGVKTLLEQYFYFSHDVDVTRRLQARLDSEDARAPPGPKDLYAEADMRFVWNARIAEPILRQEVSSSWITPVMQGFVQARPCVIPSSDSKKPPSPQLLLMLMARRGWRRAGTRFHSRGLDDGGEASSWVETEQLVRMKGSAANPLPVTGWLSLAQLRCSAPLFWEQPSNSASVALTRSPELTSIAFGRHNQKLQDEYGEVVYVNLCTAVGKKETEGVLMTGFGHQRRLMPAFKMAHLDFHARVGGLIAGIDGDFNRDLHNLVGDVMPDVQNVGYLDATQDTDAASGDPQAPRKTQTGVVRVNCFDCLDRSNVFQYQVTWEWLSAYCKQQPGLKRFVKAVPPAAPHGVMPMHSTAGLVDLWRSYAEGSQQETRPSPLQGLLQEMWADLGDALSLQVTGASSTMGGVLRQGGRSGLGVFHKMAAGVSRAYHGRWKDEARQAALGFLLGKHRLLRAPGPPEIRRSPCGRQVVLAAVTWNMHGEPLWERPGTLEALIGGAAANASEDGQAVDLMAFCFQEIVELSASNVMSMDAGDPERHDSFEKAALPALQKVMGERFVKVHSIGLIGLYVCIFAAARVGRCIRSVAADRVRSGFYGQVGNKGAVAVRCQVMETTVCVLSLHLESGGDKAAMRGEQLQEVLNTCFSKGPMPVKEHDLVAIAGDFNFRMTFPKDGDLRKLATILSNAWATATPPPAGCVGEGAIHGFPQEVAAVFGRHEELNTGGGGQARDALKASSLIEGPVLFPPTFKLLIGKEGVQEYNLERIPSWCDRIFHTKVGVVRRKYCALRDLSHSDHRPVCIALETYIQAMPGDPLLECLATRQGQQEPEPEEEQPQQPAPGQPDAAALAKKKQLERPGTFNTTIDLLSDDYGGTSLREDAVAAIPEVAELLPGLGTPDKVGPRGAPPEPLEVGMDVLAEHKGSWFRAKVTRLFAAGARCDVAWLRPPAGQSVDALYLLSTGEDETLNCDGLKVATQIRPLDDLQPSSMTPAGAPSIGCGAPTLAASQTNLETLDLMS